MLTIFTTAKPFLGHNGIIQRNALKSWKLLHPDVEVILFGDDEGAAEVCAELGLRHEAHTERHESGMKYLNSMFERAQRVARHEYLCYSNCDIVFFKDVIEAVAAARRWRQKFLMIGRRWDADVVDPLDFANRRWAEGLRQFAKTTGTLQRHHFVDYFIFPNGLYDEVPPLVIGRSWWDHWLVWKAISREAAVIDCSEFVFAVHQNHPHGYHAQGKQGTHEDELAKRNMSLAGDGKHLRHALDASHKMGRTGRIRRVFLRRYYEQPIADILQEFINVTYPVREVLGLRRATLKRIRGIFRRPRKRL
jgi:hypothetical protein